MRTHPPNPFPIEVERCFRRRKTSSGPVYHICHFRQGTERVFQLMANDRQNILQPCTDGTSLPRVFNTPESNIVCIYSYTTEGTFSRRKSFWKSSHDNIEE